MIQRAPKLIYQIYPYCGSTVLASAYDDHVHKHTAHPVEVSDAES